MYAQLLIDFGATTATAALRFPPIRGPRGFADLRNPARDRVEVLKVSRIRTRMKKALPRLNRRFAEGDPRDRGHLVGISGGNTLEDPDT